MGDTDQGLSSVRFVDDERLDIPDAGALQSLGYGYMAQALGALFGFADPANSQGVGGCLTTPVFDTAANPLVPPIGGFSFLSVTRSTSNRSAHTAEVVRYDPALASQLYKSIALTDGVLHWIWARPYTASMDTDTRRKWDSGTGREIAFSTMTRARVRVEFRVSTVAAPPVGTGRPWTPIARVGAWDAGVPTICPFFAWDALDLTETPDGTDARESIAVITVNGNGTLVHLLRNMRAQIALLRDNTGATSWLGTPVAGVNQLNASITEAQQRQIIASATVNYNTATTDLGRSTDYRWVGPDFVCQRPGVGHYNLQFVTPVTLPYPGSKPHVWTQVTEDQAVGPATQAFRRIYGFAVLNGGLTTMTDLEVVVTDINGNPVDLVDPAGGSAAFHFMVFGG